MTIPITGTFLVVMTIIGVLLWACGIISFCVLIKGVYLQSKHKPFVFSDEWDKYNAMQTLGMILAIGFAFLGLLFLAPALFP
ncbi:MAG: hypothetical protein GY845_25715 [Planctomycetes bacterium]|nr:hypothetical protein [Planctomycetota bacterium]